MSLLRFASSGLIAAAAPFTTAPSIPLDTAIASIGYRMAVSNHDLCATRGFLPGFDLHEISQYPRDQQERRRRELGLDDNPAVSGVAVGSPAERAGLRAGDHVLMMEGELPPSFDPRASGSFARMSLILEQLDRLLADGSLSLRIRRNGAEQIITFRAEQGCPSRFQTMPGEGLSADADGQYVRISVGLARFVADDQQLAAVLAHEFAHNVLRHRARLDEAGVRRGALGNFGRNARLIRETEEEADRLGVYILDRAGYDLDAALAFWERFGQHGLNFIGSPTHGNWRTRLAAIRREVEAVRAARAAGRVPEPPFPTAAGTEP